MYIGGVLCGLSILRDVWHGRVGEGCGDGCLSEWDVLSESGDVQCLVDGDGGHFMKDSLRLRERKWSKGILDDIEDHEL